MKAPTASNNDHQYDITDTPSSIKAPAAPKNDHQYDITDTPSSIKAPAAPKNDHQYDITDTPSSMKAPTASNNDHQWSITTARRTWQQLGVGGGMGASTTSTFLLSWTSVPSRATTATPRR